VRTPTTHRPPTIRFNRRRCHEGQQAKSPLLPPNTDGPPRALRYPKPSPDRADAVAYGGIKQRGRGCRARTVVTPPPRPLFARQFPPGAIKYSVFIGAHEIRFSGQDRIAAGRLRCSRVHGTRHSIITGGRTKRLGALTAVGDAPGCPLRRGLPAVSWRRLTEYLRVV
jgi:hypothetical protein